MSRSGWDKYQEDPYYSKDFDKSEKRYNWYDLEDVAWSADFLSSTEKCEEIEKELSTLKNNFGANLRVAKQEIEKQIRKENISAIAAG